MKQATKTDMTSFHGETFRASVMDLEKILGMPAYAMNDGTDKVNFEWEMETSEGEVFTVYDWKEGRSIGKSETIEWHIGSRTPSISYTALNEIADALNGLDQ